jgi:hypothetical protein
LGSWEVGGTLLVLQREGGGKEEGGGEEKLSVAVFDLWGKEKD